MTIFNVHKGINSFFSLTSSAKTYTKRASQQFMSSFLDRTKLLMAKANNLQDLTKILNHIPFESLKEMINHTLETINSSNPDKMRHIYYESSPITNIISDDVVQSMLTYIPYQNSMKFVSKSFNKFVKKADDLRTRVRQRKISSEFANKNVWIVDKTRNSLNATD